MAIVVNGNNITINSTAPNPVSTVDLLAASNITATGNIGILNGRIEIQNGGILIFDALEGLIRCNGITIQSFGNCFIGRRDPDYSFTATGGTVVPTGDPRNNDLVALYATGGQVDNVDTAAIGVQANGVLDVTGKALVEGVMLFLPNSDITLRGGGQFLGEDVNNNGTSDNARIRAQTNIDFTGPGTFFVEDTVRSDFFANANFVDGGAFAARFTPRGAFQAVSAQNGGTDEPADFPNIANIGLINGFVGDSFNGKPISLRNISTAGRDYIITHNPPTNPYSPASLIYARMDMNFADEAGNVVDTRLYSIDEGAAARTGGAGENNSAALPGVISYRDGTGTTGAYWLDSHVSNPDQANVRPFLNRQLIYEWLTQTDGTNDIVTRVVSGGLSLGGRYTNAATGVVDNPSAVHYRFTLDNNDSVRVRGGAYGYLAYEDTIQTAGNPTSNVIQNILVTDPVSTLQGHTRAQAEAFYNSGGIDRNSAIVAAIEYAWELSAANMEVVNTAFSGHRKPWSGLDSRNRVDLTGWNITLLTTGTGVTFATGVAGNQIVVSGVDASLLGDIGITIGSTGTLTAVGIDVPPNFINSNSPGAGDIVLDIPISWQNIADARYSVWQGTTQLNTDDGLLSAAIQSGQIVIRGIGNTTPVNVSFVSPFINDVRMTITGSATVPIELTVPDAVINPFAVNNADVVFNGTDTAATFFGLYNGTPAVSPVIGADPDDGTFMSFVTLVPLTQATNRSIDGSQMNNIGFNFKAGSVFEDRYAKVVARNGLNQIFATSRDEVAFEPTMRFAFTMSSEVEGGSIRFLGTDTTGTTTAPAPSLSRPAAPDINYDIIQTRVGTVMSNRNVTAENIRRLGLNIPIEEN